MNTNAYLDTKQALAKHLAPQDSANIFNFVQTLILDALDNFAVTATFTIADNAYTVAAFDAGDVLVNFAGEHFCWQEFELVVMGLVAEDLGAIESAWMVLV